MVFPFLTGDFVSPSQVASKQASSPAMFFPIFDCYFQKFAKRGQQAFPFAFKHIQTISDLIVEIK